MNTEREGSTTRSEEVYDHLLTRVEVPLVARLEHFYLLVYDLQIKKACHCRRHGPSLLYGGYMVAAIPYLPFKVLFECSIVQRVKVGALEV